MKERLRGADGRYKAREASNGESAGTKALKPGQCQAYLRSTLAKEFQTIVDGFVSEARNGGCAHMKLAAELLERTQPKPKQKGSAQRLLEQLGTE